MTNIAEAETEPTPILQMVDLCKERDVGIVAVCEGLQPPGEWGHEHFLWRVTLLYKGRSFKTDFKCGVAHVYPPKSPRGGHKRDCTSDHALSKESKCGPGKPKPPDAPDVLSCLCSDATSADRVTFEDWCSDFGYDTDSRKAEKTYLACVDTNAKLHRFLGEDFDLFAGAEH
jgi:hypothetical protein